MRGCVKLAMTFGLVALLAGPALAQGGRGGFGVGMGAGGPVGLLGNESVQNELKLDAEQKEKAAKLATEVGEKMASVREQLQDLQGPERMTKMQELARPINESAMKTAAEFLKAEQVKRLHEIELQNRGIRAFSDPVVAKKLSITSEQETKVKSLMADMQSERREIMQSAGDDWASAMPKIQALMKETSTKVMALMTDDQKKTWKEMTGEPFTIVQPQRRRPGNN